MDTSLWNAPRGYFNTALRGIPPMSSVEAAKRTLDLWSRGDLDWLTWLEELRKVRQEFGALIGVSPARIGVGHTTAALVNVVAANLKPGSRVLVPADGASAALLTKWAWLTFTATTRAPEIVQAAER